MYSTVRIYLWSTACGTRHAKMCIWAYADSEGPHHFTEFSWNVKSCLNWEKIKKKYYDCVICWISPVSGKGEIILNKNIFAVIQKWTINNII